jgi:hypothetical protein
VQNTAGVAIYEGFFAGWAHCGITIGELCSYASETPLRQGSTYNWFVRGINNEGAGPWSAPRAITVDSAAVVEAPLAVYPDGVSGFVTDASFTWKRIRGNISYQVLVQNTAGVAFDRTYSAAEVNCVESHEQCSAYATGIPPGTYNWYVRVTTAAGTSGWSDGHLVIIGSDFVNAFPTSCLAPNSGGWQNPPAGVTTGWIANYSFSTEGRCSLSSNGFIGPGTAEIRLAAIFNAGLISFDRKVSSEEGKDCLRFLIDGTQQDLMGSCGSGLGASGEDTMMRIAVPVTAGAHTLTWSYEKDGTGSAGFDTAWIDNLVMPIVDTVPATPTGVAPSGAVVSQTPTFQWTAAAGAVSYDIIVTQQPSGNRVGYASVTAASGGCSSGSGMCSSLLPGSFAAGGSYTWMVRAATATALSAWSAPVAFSVSATPMLETPTILGPTGTVWTSSPELSWTAVTGASTYEVEVTPSDGPSFSDTYVVGNIFCQPNCTARLRRPVADGVSYAWRVRASGGNSAPGVFSATSTFTIKAPAAMTPSGTISTTTPTFTWEQAPGANGIELQITGPGGFTSGLSFSFAGSVATCNGTTCSAGPPHLSFPFVDGGTYTWRVSAGVPGGFTLYGPAATFTVRTSSSPPPAPTTLLPSGIMSTRTPTYSWNAIPGLSSYQLLVQNTAGVMVDLTYAPGAANCSTGSGICSVTPSTALANGTIYNWFVRATNALGTGPWSAPRQIEVSIAGQIPAIPTSISPTSAITTTTPLYVWNPVADATTYRLQVTQAGGGIVFSLPYTTELACTTTCSINPNVQLTNGQSYTWSVSAANASGSSAMSAPRSFNVALPTGPVVPGAPTLISPTGATANLTPVYTWNATAGASSYELIVQNTAGVALNLTYSASAAGCAAGTGTCSVQPTTALANGAVYNWFVRATSAAGTSPWSGALTINISVLGPSIPVAPIPLGPAGTINTTTPTFSWNAMLGAVSYYLLAQNTAGVAVSMSVTPAAAGCGAGTGICSIVAPGSLTNGAVYNWFVNATNNLGTGPWSSATTITVNAVGPGLPTPPIQTGPSGSPAGILPTYIWQESPSATSYYLVVQNTAGVALATTVPASACNAGTCSLHQPDPPLGPSTAYSWFVKSINSYGESAWSSGLSFRTN